MLHKINYTALILYFPDIKKIWCSELDMSSFLDSNVLFFLCGTIELAICGERNMIALDFYSSCMPRVAIS